jgi:hypothetical protein
VLNKQLILRYLDVTVVSVVKKQNKTIDCNKLLLKCRVDKISLHVFKIVSKSLKMIPLYYYIPILLAGIDQSV